MDLALRRELVEQVHAPTAWVGPDDELVLANAALRARMGWESLPPTFDARPGQRRVLGPDGPFNAAISAMPLTEGLRWVTLVDLDDRARFLQRLHDARDTWSFRMLDAAPSAMSVHRHGHVAWGNRAFTELCGHTPAERQVPLPNPQLVHPDDLARSVRQSAEVYRTGRDSSPYEIRILRADGGPLPVRVVLSRIAFADQLGLLATATDLRTERELQALRELEVERRLEGRLRHALTNPLTAVMTNLAYAVQETDGEPREAIRDALESARRMANLVAQGDSSESTP